MKENYFNIYNEHIESIIDLGDTKDLFNKIAAGINEPDLFLDPDGVHGKGHTIRVMILASIISCLEELSIDEKTILAYSGLYHDIGRVNDIYDVTHGKKSYSKLVSTGLLFTIKLRNENLEIMKYIIENHCISDVRAKVSIARYDIKNKDKALRLFNVFKDADGLDRVRLGDLNEKYLRLQSSKKLVTFARNLLLDLDMNQ